MNYNFEISQFQFILSLYISYKLLYFDIKSLSIYESFEYKNNI